MFVVGCPYAVNVSIAHSHELTTGQPTGPVAEAFADVEAGHIYWTNMGNPKVNDGSIDRANLDGTNVTNIVPSGATWTPKQLQLDAKNR